MAFTSWRCPSLSGWASLFASLASRRTGVTRYPAPHGVRECPDFPPTESSVSDYPPGYPYYDTPHGADAIRIVWYRISMNVRTKFFLHMTILFAVVAMFGMFVYITATEPVFEDTDESLPFRNIDIESGGGNDIGFNSILPGRNDGTETPAPPTETGAVVTLADPIVPEKELSDSDSGGSEPLDGEVRYRVLLRISWSPSLHADWYPDGAHLSPMVAWSHRVPDTVFTDGEPAGDGMEIMAETGATDTLRKELDAFGEDGYLFHYTVGTVTDAPGEDSVSLLLTPTAPLVSVVSMIAPSPDWFIAVRNAELFENGRWIGRKTVPAVLYDAGTDDGDSFTARNRDTNPPEPITRFPDAPTVPIATVEFMRIQ